MKNKDKIKRIVYKNNKKLKKNIKHKYYYYHFN